MADYERPQETSTPLRLDVLFASLSVQQLFMKYYSHLDSHKRPYVTIDSVDDKNGRFQGEIASDFTVNFFAME